MDESFPIQLQVITLKTEKLACQTLAINLVNPAELVTTDPLSKLALPPELDLTREVVLFGTAPTWLYANLVERCYDAPWVACYNIREKAAVVVASRVDWPRPGDILPVIFNQIPGAAILIGGPPNSGKSVLSNALRCCLQKRVPQRKVYLHRANWDGEGNWTYEAANRKEVEPLVDYNTRRIHLLPNAEKLLTNYFSYHAQAVRNICDVVDVALVDIGGMPQAVKMPVVKECSHYIIISNSPEKVPEWHNFLQLYLKPIAVIHSVLEEREYLIETDPFLQVVAGPWIAGETFTVPELLLKHFMSLLSL